MREPGSKGGARSTGEITRDTGFLWGRERGEGGGLIRGGKQGAKGARGLRETGKENSAYGIPMGTGTGRRRGSEVYGGVKSGYGVPIGTGTERRRGIDSGLEPRRKGGGGVYGRQETKTRDTGFPWGREPKEIKKLATLSNILQ